MGVNLQAAARPGRTGGLAAALAWRARPRRAGPACRGHRAAQHQPDPARLHLGPDEERLGLQRGQADPDRVSRGGEDHEPGHPDGRELGVELVERLDLEPPGHEDQDAPPGTRDRAGADPLAAFERRPERGEVQRDAGHAEFGGALDGLGDHEVVQAGLGGPVPPHQVEREPVAAPGHEVQQRLERAVLGGGREHAPLVAWAADPAECHREPAFRRVPAPGVGLPDQPGDLVGRHVTHPADLGDVAGPADPGHHLPDIAHRPTLQREAGDLDHRLVAEFQRGQLAVAAPDLGAMLAAAHDGGNPGVPGRHVEERLDRARPRLLVADRIAAGQHDTGNHPVPDAGLPRRRPDHALVVAQREVAERVAPAVPVKQRPDLRGVVAAEAALRLGRPQGRLGGNDASQIRSLLDRHGRCDSLGYFALRDDKSVIWSATRKSCIGYRVVSGVMLASGDPLGDKEAWPGAIEAFLDMAARHAWVPAVIGCSELGAEIWCRQGELTALELGDEAVVQVCDFSLQGRAMRNVRQMVTRVSRAGYVAEVCRVGDVPADEIARLVRQADSWRGNPTERGFSMALGRIGGPGDERCVIATATQDGVLKALLHCVPWGSDGLSLDLMRRDRSAQPGLNDFMIAETIKSAPELGVTRISLNFAAFRAALERGERIGAGPITRAWRRVLIFMSRWFQIESLYKFNAKFAPVWVPRFMVFTSTRDAIRVGLAALEAEAFLVWPKVEARRIRRMLRSAVTPARRTRAPRPSAPR